jgi:translation initiation factor IF-2
MPSPRANSKDHSGKRSAGASTVGSRSHSAKSAPAPAAAKPAPPVEAAPPAPVKPAVEKPPTVSLIDTGEKNTAPAKPRVLKPLPTIGKPKTPPPAPVQAPAPEPVVKAAPAPVAARPVVDLISSPGSKSRLLVPVVGPQKAPEPEAPAVVEPTPVASAPVPALAPDPIPAPVEEVISDDKILHIKPPILVKELAVHLGLKLHQLNRDLIAMEIFASPTQVLEQEVVSALCKKHGFVLEVERREKGGGVHKQEAVVVAPPPPVIVDPEAELKTRAPIIAFMGHVDHGKTSLMDAIRKTRVTAGEAGGITQHIGAYSVTYQGKPITFLDTPGHAAFTAMRARGANITDIVVIVVAADDGLMPQTLEAINHAKAAKVNIMVAINKIDLAGANIDRVKKQLQDQGLTPDDWGGETTCCPVSATKGTGIDHLLEMMTLQAELMDLKASPTAPPRGTVIEAQIEAGRGPTATIIVRMGTLKTGDAFICGDYSGKVKALFDDLGKSIKSAGPSTPVKVVGFSGLPGAGDEFLVMDSERSAKTLSEERLLDSRNKKMVAPQRATLESLFHAADTHKTLRIVLKADVQGSLEAIITSLNQIESKKISVDFIHAAVGPVSESDVLLASASNAIIIGFSTKVENVSLVAAKREGVQIKLYSIIYELIDQVKEAMVGLLDPELRETIIGHAEVKQVFDLTKGKVAGCIVTNGRVARTARARVLRRRQAVYDGGLATLRRFQDEVKEVRAGVECGIKLGDYSDYQVEDIIECYQLEKVAQKL